MRCVIADDSMVIRPRLKAYLNAAGHQVVGVATNGKEGYDMCKLHKPEIAIFDVSMPVMNGDDAALRVKREGLAKFIIIASSQVQAATLDNLRRDGIHIISKPYFQDKLITQLARIIAGPPPDGGEAIAA